MATTDLIGAPERTVHPTAPLPPAAAEALARYELASFRTAQLSDWLYRYGLSDADFDSLEFWQDTMRETRALLAAAGMLHLVEASDEHGKTKPPLPVRPPRPNPHAGVVAS